MHELGVGDDERTALFHAARAELGRLAGDDRLVLLVDDLDLLDDTSVAVLVPLVVARRVFLIGTVRTGGAPVAAADAGCIATATWSASTSSRCPATSSARCCTGRSTARSRPRALAELARLSGGNLQVLTELVRGARERGALVAHRRRRGS